MRFSFLRSLKGSSFKSGSTSEVKTWWKRKIQVSVSCSFDLKEEREKSVMTVVKVAVAVGW